MRKSILIYLIPLTLVIASPSLPDSGRDSRDVAFLKNLGPNLLPIAFWLTIGIFITRCALAFVGWWNRGSSPAGFEVVIGREHAPPPPPQRAPDGAFGKSDGPP
jgi:hypothetical protein